MWWGWRINAHCFQQPQMGLHSVCHSFIEDHFTVCFPGIVLSQSTAYCDKQMHIKLCDLVNVYIGNLNCQHRCITNCNRQNLTSMIRDATNFYQNFLKCLEISWNCSCSSSFVQEELCKKFPEIRKFLEKCHLWTIMNMKCWLPGHLLSHFSHNTRSNDRNYNTPVGPVTCTCGSQSMKIGCDYNEGNCFGKWYPVKTAITVGLLFKLLMDNCAKWWISKIYTKQAYFSISPDSDFAFAIHTSQFPVEVIT